MIMNKKDKGIFVSFLDSYRHMRNRRYFVGGLAFIVAICTSLALMVPAITLSDDVYCGLEEHQHSEQCYEKTLICEMTNEEHEHLDACYEQLLTCTLTQHTHEDTCYQEQAKYYCLLEEHIHDDTCEEECLLEEHIHDENCMMEGVLQGVLACKEQHDHTKDCYVELQEEQVKDDIVMSQAVATQQTYNLLTITSLDDLDGQSVLIVNQSANSHALGTVSKNVNKVGQNDPDRLFLVGNRVTIDNDAIKVSDVELYTFTKLDNGNFHITSMDGRFLAFEDDSTNGSGVILTDTPTELIVSLHTMNGKQGIAIKCENGHYLDWYGQNGSEDFFGGWKNTTPSNNQIMTLYEMYVPTSINYDVIGNTSWASQSWDDNNEPAVTHPSVAMTPGSSGTLQEIQNANEDGYFISTTGQTGSWVYNSSQSFSVQDAIQLMKNDGLPYGKTYRFEGWEADIDGETYLFAEGSPYHIEDDGTLVLTDVDGVVHYVDEEGIIFTAKYTEICDLVLFFVNYSGTILDTEDNVTGRNQGDFTGVVALGHIYYGTQTVGQNDTFLMATDSQIKSYFRYEADLEDPSTQIVISHLAELVDGRFENVQRMGVNPTEVEAAVLNFLKDNNQTIKLSAKDPVDERPSLDPQYADTDHYSVLWYVAKEQGDFWHIDGVLVAKTTEINVAKSFTGLSDEQVYSIFDNGYGVEVYIGEGDSTNTLGQRYLTLGTSSVPGQYEFFGYDEATNTARWSLRALRDERYAVKEINPGIDGYSCSTGIVVQSTSSYSIDFGEYSVNGLVGGDTISVSFNNFYTPDQTGILSVIKRDGSQAMDTQHGATLKGAVFELRDLDGNVIATRTTTDQGLAYFPQLGAGTYKLVETVAPEGFLDPSFEAYVFVEEINGGIMISVSDDETKDDSDTVVFDTSGTVSLNGLQDFYYVDNMPYPNTITVTKSFRGITSAQLQDWVAEDALLPELEGYHISVFNTSTQEERILTLQNADNIIQASNMYTWRITGLDYGQFVVTERNYRHDAYNDTIVDAVVNGFDSEVSFGDDEAYIEFNVNPRSRDVINLTNTYTNVFDLYLQKVDSVTKKPLPGAVFKLYGGYDESTDTSQTIIHNGVQYFYISQITSDKNGYAIQKDLNLSTEGEDFVYILDEISSPTYYQKLSEPIQVHVTIDSENYINNIFTTEAPNTRTSQTLEITKAVGGEQAEYVPDDVEYHMEIDFYEPDGTLDTLHEYPYTIYNSDDSVASNGIITSEANTFILKKDQKIFFNEVPVLYEYVLKETNATFNGSETIILEDALSSSIQFNSFSQSFETNDNALISTSAREMRGVVLADGEQEIENKATLTNSFPREEVYTTFKVTKVWNDPLNEEKEDVQIEMYRKTILDGNETLEKMETITLNDENNWTYQWENQLVYGENGETYIYYIREVPMSGYRAEYNQSVLKDQEDDQGNQIDIVLASGEKDIQVTNIRVFEIPETGGNGITNFYLGGFLLLILALWMKQNNKQKGDA